MKRSALSKTISLNPAEESFFQIQDQAGPYIDALAAAQPNAFRVFWWLIGQANQQNKVIADQTRLGRELGLHRNTVSKAVAYLRDQRFLQTYKAGTTNGYCLNAWVIWRDGRAKRPKAPFLESLQVQVEPALRSANPTSAPRSLRTSKGLTFSTAQHTPSDILSPEAEAEAEAARKFLKEIRETERQDAPERLRKLNMLKKKKATPRDYEPRFPSSEEMRAPDADYGYEENE